MNEPNSDGLNPVEKPTDDLKEATKELVGRRQVLLKAGKLLGTGLAAGLGLGLLGGPTQSKVEAACCGFCGPCLGGCTNVCYGICAAFCSHCSDCGGLCSVYCDAPGCYDACTPHGPMNLASRTQEDTEAPKGDWLA